MGRLTGRFNLLQQPEEHGSHQRGRRRSSGLHLELRPRGEKSHPLETKQQRRRRVVDHYRSFRG